MPQISTLITGAGVQTPIVGQDHLDNCMYLGDVDTPMPLQGVQVDVGGETIINIQASQPLVSVFAKFMQSLVAGTVGLMLKFATGKIQKATNIRLTNNGVTTPAIFTFSDAKDGKPFRAVSDTINAASSKDFRKFSALFITPAANLGSVDITYRDGTVQNMVATDLDALFASKNETEANGRLDAVVTGIDNREMLIDTVRVNATTAVTVLLINFSDADFQVLKNSAGV
jgi:hypothetical protein